MDNQPESLGEAFQKVQDEVSLMHTKWEIYRELFLRSDKRRKLLTESAYAFFFLIRVVLLDDVRVSLSRLTEPARDKKNHANLSFARLRELAEENGDSDFAEELKKQLAELGKKCRVIKTHRNKRLAHNDLTTAMQGGANLEPISVEDIESVLELTRKYMTTIGDHYDHPRTLYDSGIDLTSGAEKLVGLLKLGLHFKELLYDGKIPLDECFKGKWSDA
jgi:hypothetical protein